LIQLSLRGATRRRASRAPGAVGARRAPPASAPCVQGGTSDQGLVHIPSYRTGGYRTKRIIDAGEHSYALRCRNRYRHNTHDKGRAIRETPGRDRVKMGQRDFAGADEYRPTSHERPFRSRHWCTALIFAPADVPQRWRRTNTIIESTWTESAQRLAAAILRYHLQPNQGPERQAGGRGQIANDMCLQ